MFELVTPHRRFHRSYLAAADEFIAAGDEHHANLLSWPADATFAGLEFTREALEHPGTFAEMAAFMASQRHPSSPRPSSYVPYTELWMGEGREYLGRLSIRHELNELLLTWGGHIGYAVRPTARRRGYATRALALALPICVELGIDPALVTCDVENVASRRVIESNGGVYEDTREGKQRFWVPTRQS